MNMMQLQNLTMFQMKSMTKKVFLIAAATISFQCYAANELQIIDKGQDGNTRYYSVGCADGSVGTIEVTFKETSVAPVSEDVVRARTGNAKPAKAQITNICASPGSDNEKCNASWKMQTAAKQSCK